MTQILELLQAVERKQIASPQRKEPQGRLGPLWGLVRRLYPVCSDLSYHHLFRSFLENLN